MSTAYYKTAQDFDWFKHYPAAFVTETAHLSHVELGVYRRLLDHYWSADNKLPSDPAEIVERIGEKIFNWRRYGVTVPTGFDSEGIAIKVIEHILCEFFEQDEDGNWRHVWLDEYRSATDKQFQDRSKASKERAARQSRGPGGKFGKDVTVPDGKSRCDTVNGTVTDGEADGGLAVEQSKAESKQNKLHSEQTRSNQNKAPNIARTLPPKQSVTLDEKLPLADFSKNAFGQKSKPAGAAQGRPASDYSSAPSEYGPNWEAA